MAMLMVDMFRLYGAVFEREKWIATFIQQNHEAALRKLIFNHSIGFVK
jgi:hypothetical protein